MNEQTEFDELFEAEPVEFEIDGVVVPSDHSVYKLFPGKTYRLAKAMHDSRHAFLDIAGLTDLEGAPSEWSDDAVLRVITMERVLREIGQPCCRKLKQSGAAQDKRRLGFLKNLFFKAKKGDLILVPLGDGFASQIAVGELQDEAGDVHRISYTANEKTAETFGRRVRWVCRVDKNKLSPKLVSSLHSSTAFHLLPESVHEEVYIHSYGTFTYNGIYVAKFETDKETFTPTDYANIGALFNGLAVIHDQAKENIKSEEEFLELAMLSDNSATMELRRNSPISVLIRTVGPLAFTTAVIFSASADGREPRDLQNVQISARTIGHATDICKIDVPPDVASAADGFGLSRWKTYCRVQSNVRKGATVRSPARLKKSHKKPR